MRLEDWFLTADERGNAATLLDRRHPDGAAWTTGNQVHPLVHGATYFAELLERLQQMGRDDQVYFTDWRGDPDERLTDAGPTIAEALAGAAGREAVVKGLVWRSHLDRFAFSAQENRHLGEEIEAAGGECLLDMRVRPGGSHHQKFVVCRRPGAPTDDVAFVGGIDLCHSRRDDAEHGGDPQPQPMAVAYGDRPPWHDVQVAIHGPAVGDVEAVFRERWADPAPLSRAPWRRLSDRLRGDDVRADPLPRWRPDPEPRGEHAVQLLRTYPFRRPGYSFAPRGERSVARGYAKALTRARQLVYVEDQYLWSRVIAGQFADALRRNRQLHLIAVVPRVPDQDGRTSLPPNNVGRADALTMLRAAGGERVAVYDVENRAGTPVYVHAKVCVVDDVWASVGSDNVNRRSWTHDSELACAVLDQARDPREPTDPAGFGDGARVYARSLRLQLAREHLDRVEGDDADLVEVRSAFAAFRRSAEELEAWHAAGCRGTRPPGRLRPHRTEHPGRLTRLWATPMYRVVYDPDGRPPAMRRRDEF